MRATTRTTTKRTSLKAGGRAPAPRPQPQRTCVACRGTGDQSSLVRLVRSPEGPVVVDEGRRRAPGRGAYLHRDAACWARGVKDALGNALRTTIGEAEREALLAYASRFAPGAARDDNRGAEDADAARRDEGEAES